MPEGRFRYSLTRTSTWTHIVLNYIGPNNGEGIKMYENGGLKGINIIKLPGSTSYQNGNGRIVVGRQFTGSNDYYASIEIDEFVFFNTALDNGEVMSIYNSA